MEERIEELKNIFASQTEWLAIDCSSGKSFALNAAEIDLESEGGKTLFGFLSEKGFEYFRLIEWNEEKRKIILFLSKNFGKERLKIEFVPRLSSKESADAVELARAEKANKIAARLIDDEPEAKLIKVSLKRENGRLATIIFQNRNGKTIAALADVSDSLTADFLISAAILGKEKSSARKNPITEICLISDKKTSGALQKLHALLREETRKKIQIKEISGAESSPDLKLKKVGKLELKSLWRGKITEENQTRIKTQSAAARAIIECAPCEIDAVFSKQGETLRFNGLPFARVRRISGEEKIWFGTENKLQPLETQNIEEFAKLIDELKIHRRFDAPNRRHFFYKHASEAWLESILRRNIKLLDANLIIAPLYNQYRAERGKIDILAIRRDGRLVIVEIKTAPDREMIFQAADYWRKIEKQRRLGNLEKAKIFGEMKIKNEAPLVYLVAPLLAFHLDFEVLSQAIIPEIEFYKFVLNENWRQKIKNTILKV